MKSAEFLKACRRKYSNTGGLEIQSLHCGHPKMSWSPWKISGKEPLHFFPVKNNNLLHMKGIVTRD
jgi:hypothetical protein